MKPVTCHCSKTFTDALKLSKHRQFCAAFQREHYHRSASMSKMKADTRVWNKASKGVR